MFLRAEKLPDQWLLSNSFGHQLGLPCQTDYSGRCLAIGVLGTGTRVPLKLKTTKTEAMAAMLAALDRPLYLLDVRRAGVGGQGSWAPLEFATLIPDFLLRARVSHPYSCLHLPSLAPSVELLKDERTGVLPGYQAFAQCYRDEHAEQTWDIGRAFVEAMAAVGGLAIFLCSEADQPTFATLPAKEQQASYCHRFTLAQQVARRIRSAYHDATVQLIQLDLVDYCAQRTQGQAYAPRVVGL